MIGNDVIDLQIPPSKNWDTSRYLNKIFLPIEQEFVFQSAEPIIYLQLFWSLKEAAYKAHQRRFDLPRTYNPLQFSTQLSSETEEKILGKVVIGSKVYHTNSIICEGHIHSIATSVPDYNYLFNLFDFKIDVKKQLLLQYSITSNIPDTELNIQKNENQIPFLYRNKLKLEIDFSLSHHGKFSAFVLALTNS